MRTASILLCISTIFFGCKNNGSNTASSKSTNEMVTPAKRVKEIVVGAERKPSRPDFQVLSMSNTGDELAVVFQYSGGCEEHDFNAHFSGGWLKSLPPQAVIDFEHLNPKNDACRSIVKDTVLFDITPLRYPGGEKVIVKYPEGQGTQVMYEYSN